MATGNLKLDVAAPPADAAKLERLMSVTRGRPIISRRRPIPARRKFCLRRTGRLRDYFPSLLA